MQLIKIVLHGILKDRYDSFAVAGASAADAIEGWSRQVGCDRRDLIQVVDFDTEEKLRAKTDVTELHLVPTMFGGGGAVGRILIGAALVVAGVLLAPASPIIGSALVGAGIGMAIGGVMQIFMKQPTASKSEDPPASKYLGSGKNTTAIGTVIGFGGGRMLVGGQFMSIQVDSSELVYGTYPTTPT